MGLFSFLFNRKPKRPYECSGSGQSKNDPVKLIPRNRDAMIDGMLPVLKKGKPELFALGDEDMIRQMVGGMLGAMCKTMWLEDRLGKEGVGFTYGDRLYHEAGIIEQKVIWSNGGTHTVFFDCSAFE